MKKKTLVFLVLTAFTVVTVLWAGNRQMNKGVTDEWTQTDWDVVGQLDSMLSAATVKPFSLSGTIELTGGIAGDSLIESQAFFLNYESEDHYCYTLDELSFLRTADRFFRVDRSMALIDELDGTQIKEATPKGQLQRLREALAAGELRAAVWRGAQGKRKIKIEGLHEGAVNGGELIYDQQFRLSAVTTDITDMQAGVARINTLKTTYRSYDRPQPMPLILQNDSLVIKEPSLLNFTVNRTGTLKNPTP
jgi:hypothetical protein